MTSQDAPNFLAMKKLFHMPPWTPRGSLQLLVMSPQEFALTEFTYIDRETGTVDAVSVEA